MKRKIVAIRRSTEGCKHISHVISEEKDIIEAKDAIEFLKVGSELYMTPPPGAPAYEAHKTTGLDLILQFRTCKDCDQEILWA